MSTVADYQGRTVDVLAYDGATPAGEVLLEQIMAQPGEGGKITTGIQKLAQRFILELFTETGSQFYFPGRGTRFLTEARRGVLRTPADIFASFSRALVDIKRNLQLEESDADPSDERYQDAVILEVTFVNGVASVKVFIFSQAGGSRQVILPINVSLRG